ncbi:MAG: aldehyde ferredoxin oxidoreductase C-terminal domain-containing protein, partial [Candidatus Ranarchaeia archaeon]
DQKLPYEKPATVGWNKGNVVDIQKQKQVIESYYAGRGWDPKTSIPKRETLEAWGLEDEAKFSDEIRSRVQAEPEHPYEEFEK